jgi:hypothetical protein
MSTGSIEAHFSNAVLEEETCFGELEAWMGGTVSPGCFGSDLETAASELVRYRSKVIEEMLLRIVVVV